MTQFTEKAHYYIVYSTILRALKRHRWFMKQSMNTTFPSLYSVYPILVTVCFIGIIFKSMQKQCF